VNDPILSTVFAAMARSEVLGAAAAVRRDGGRALALGTARLRCLSAEEIDRLEGLGNTADDWSRVRVAEGFDWRRVRSCSFQGDVLLGAFRGRVRVSEGVELPAGVSHSTLADCVVGHDALVRGVSLLANYVVAESAVVLDCGCVSCSGETAFGNGVALPLGIESGGRDVHVYAEIDLAVVTAVARGRSRHDFLRRYARAVAAYAARARSCRGVLGRGAVVCHTPTVRNVYVGPHAVVEGATLVEDSTLLSDADEPVRVQSGAVVTSSLLQWGSQVDTLALVDHAVLLEHARAERHGKVSTSVLGPNTVVAEGEVTACLLGPFVGFHHQALLIAALWPEGKGNVSYGANAGSNHTTKAPDQEFWPGEGAFLGLGVNIKFPSDFSRAPYTVIASGVSTLPQKLAFPFALVNVPATRWPDISPAFNELIPAWLLTDNLFTLKRNEAKYRARNQARRTPLTFEVFRPDTVDLMRDACARLEAVGPLKDVYTERDVPGLGKNFLREATRQPAIAAYRFYVRYYALLGLLGRVRAAFREGPVEGLSRLLVTPDDDPRWEHQRRLLAGELGVPDVVAGLRQLPDMLEQVARDVERSKAKDDERGPGIIDDYAETHPLACQDRFVRQTWDETHRLQAELKRLLLRLESCPLPPEATPQPRHEMHERVAG
jgi:hypothetical protein